MNDLRRISPESTGNYFNRPKDIEPETNDEIEELDSSLLVEDLEEDVGNAKKSPSSELAEELAGLKRMHEEKLREEQLQKREINIPNNDVGTLSEEPTVVTTKRDNTQATKKVYISNSHSGLSGGRKISATETFPSQPKAFTATQPSEKDWFEQYNESYDLEKPSPTPNNETLETNNPAVESDRKKIKPPSMWDKIRNKTANILKVIGLVGAVTGTAEVVKNVKIAGAEASEDSVQSSWDTASPFDKFTLSVKELPTHASQGDIDPRFTQVKLLEQVIKHNDRQDLKGQLDDLKYKLSEKDGWANPKRQGEFNVLLQDSKIRKILKSQPKLTTADAFSLLKATILDTDVGNAETKLRKKIEQRNAFSDTQIIEPNTDKVIIFNYATKDAGTIFKGAELKKMAQVALGEKARQNPDKYIQLIDTNEVKDVTQETSGDILIKSIQESRGKRVVYLNSHASPNELAIDLSNPSKPQTLKTEGLASAFLTNMINTIQEKGPEFGRSSLGEVKIIIDGCEGYDLVGKNIISEMQHIYNESNYETITGVPFDKLQLPTVVTMAGEKSPVLAVDQIFEQSYPSGSRALVQDKYLNLIKQKGGLNGSILLQLQSESYTSGGDMGIFVSGQGKLDEISSNITSKQKNGSFNYGNKKLDFNSKSGTRNA